MKCYAVCLFVAVLFTACSKGSSGNEEQDVCGGDEEQDVYRGD